MKRPEAGSSPSEIDKLVALPAKALCGNVEPMIEAPNPVRRRELAHLNPHALRGSL
jgi:hypothetical protein